MIKKLLPATAVLMAALALGGCAGGANSPSAQLAEKIESAKTAADHEEIAKYYEAEAVKARAQAADHRKLKTLYQGVSARAPHGSTAGPGNAPAYHNTLSSQEEAAATAFESLAAEHHAMAKAASK